MNYPTTARRYGNTAGQMNTKEDIAAELAGRSADTPVSAAQTSQTQQLASGLAQQQTDGNAMTGGGGNAMTKQTAGSATQGNNNTVSGQGYRIQTYPNGYTMQIPNGPQLTGNGATVYSGGTAYVPDGPLPSAAGNNNAVSGQGYRIRTYPNGYTMQIPNGPQLTGNGATVYSGGTAYVPDGPLPSAAGQAASDGTQGGGSRPVWIRGYADAQGLGHLVTWDEERQQPLLGGVPVPVEYLSDGRAYVDQNVLDSLIARYKQNTNSNSPTGVTDTVMDRHQKNIDKALNKVVDRGEWSYDPLNDPAYQAYARQYAENAERAYNRAMGSGGLYGSPNSYQYYQALAGYGDNMQKLSDMVPTLAQQDYGRYSDEQTRNRAALEALQAERNADLSARYTATMAQLAQQRAADETDYQRREDSLLNYPAKAESVAQMRAQTRQALNDASNSDYYASRYGDILDANVDSSRAGIAGQWAQNTGQTISNIVNLGLQLGYFPDWLTTELGIPKNMAKYPDSNGYPKPGTPEAERMLAQWNIANRQITKDTWNINNGLG